MFRDKPDLSLNGINKGVERMTARRIDLDDAPPRLWRKLELNEWTFSVFLLLMSLTIFLAKLCTSYGTGYNNALLSSVRSGILDTSNAAHLSDSKQPLSGSNRFLDITDHCRDVIENTLALGYQRYGWAVRAATSGFIMTAFTWYIVYKDSRVPGVDPPSPVGPSVRRPFKESRIHSNYLVGVVNGILLSVFMCL